MGNLKEEKYTELRRRLIVAVPLIALVVTSLAVEDIWRLLIAFVSLLAFIEFSEAFFKSEKKPPFLELLYVVVIVVGFFGMYDVRQGDDGLALSVLLIVSAAVADTAAYLAGKAFDGKKLEWLKNVSPNKTMEGFAGGLLGGWLTAIAIIWLMDTGLSAQQMTVVVIGLPFVAIAGDLLASLVKRILGIKDFGWVLGSHGGIIDRVDSHILVFSVFYVFFALT